jgi:hypothetical protein
MYFGETTNITDLDITYTGIAETHTNQSNSSMTIGTFFESIQDSHTLHLNSAENLMLEEQAIGTHTTTSTQSASTMHMTYSRMSLLKLSVKTHITNSEVN